MISQDLQINNRYGIHARPSSLLSELANTFTSSITLIKGDKSADVRSVMELILLCVEPGATVTIQIDGDDEHEALLAFVDLIERRRFDEESYE